MAGMRSSGIGRTGYRERRSSQAQGPAGGVDGSRPDVLKHRLPRLASPLEDSSLIARGRRPLVVARSADVDLGGGRLTIFQLDGDRLMGEMRAFLGIEPGHILGRHPFDQDSQNES